LPLVKDLPDAATTSVTRVEDMSHASESIASAPATCDPGFRALLWRDGLAQYAIFVITGNVIPTASFSPTKNDTVLSATPVVRLSSIEEPIAQTGTVDPDEFAFFLAVGEADPVMGPPTSHCFPCLSHLTAIENNSDSSAPYLT